jgi:hypothetical protein
VIDVFVEEVKPLSQAAEWVPRRWREKEGGPPGKASHRPTSASTLWRWHTRGLAGIRLEVIYIGERRCTSREALQRFFTSVTEARQRDPAAVPGSQPAGSARAETRRRLLAAAKAEAQLDVMLKNPPRRDRKAVGAAE